MCTLTLRVAISMNYTEKIKKAQEVMPWLAEGKSVEYCMQNLKEMGYDKWDAEKIVKSATTQIKAQYSESIRAQMLDGTLEDHLDDYDELSSDLFEEIQYEQIEKIKYETRKNVRQQLQKGKSAESLVDEYVNDYFTKEEFDETVDSFSGQRSRSNNYEYIGIGAIVLGVLLTLTVRNFSGGIVVFYGLIGYGIYNIFKAYNERQKRYD